MNQKIKSAFILILITLSILTVYTLVKAMQIIPSHGSEVQKFVDADRSEDVLYPKRILYSVGCTIGNVRGEDSYLNTLKGQINYCNRISKKVNGVKAGYYVHDFNVGRSIYLSERRINKYRKFESISFPDNLFGEVESSYVLDNPCEIVRDGINCTLEGEEYNLYSSVNYLKGKGDNIETPLIIYPRGIFTEYKLTKEFFFLCSRHYT